MYADIGLARWVIDIRDNVLQFNQNKQPLFDDTPIEEKISIWVDRWNEICMVGSEHGFEVIEIMRNPSKPHTAIDTRQSSCKV